MGMASADMRSAGLQVLCGAGNAALGNLHSGQQLQAYQPSYQQYAQQQQAQAMQDFLVQKMALRQSPEARVHILEPTVSAPEAWLRRRVKEILWYAEA